MNYDFDLRKYLAEGWLFKETGEEVLEEDGKLSPANLNKVQNFNRKQKFLEKIKSGEPFIVDLGKGQEEVFVPYEDNKDILHYFEKQEPIPSRNFTVTIDHNGEKENIPLTKFIKTKEFGGGGGQAGGTKQTKYLESGQCLVNALVAEGKFEGFKSSIKSSGLKCRLGKDLTVEEVWKYLQGLGESWQRTLERTAIHLNSRFGEGYWHWQDSFMQSVGKVYAGLSDKMEGSIDRWNPADIWFTKEDTNSVTSLLSGEPECLADYTRQMNVLYEKKIAAGVSLKKLEGEDAQSEERNPDNYKNFKLSNCKVRELAPGSTTLNIEFDNNGVTNLVAIRKGNEFKLRVGTKKASGGQHFDGGCTEPILDRCLRIVATEEDIQKCHPEFYRKAAKENNMVASRVALEHLYKLLTTTSRLDKFTTELVKYCWSVVPQSARHYKVF